MWAEYLGGDQHLFQFEPERKRNPPGESRVNQGFRRRCSHLKIPPSHLDSPLDWGCNDLPCATWPLPKADEISIRLATINGFAPSS